MKKQYPLFCSLAIFGFALIIICSRAYADDNSRLNDQTESIPSVYQLESQFESQLTTRNEPYGQPKATCYYDDLVDHYEHDQLMRDVIDK